MDRARAQRVIDLFERRGEAEAIVGANDAAVRVCLGRAHDRLAAAELLFEAQHWDVVFTTAYDAYRMAAEAVVLSLGYRVPAIPGAHRITIDVAGAALSHATPAFSGSSAERFRTGRHDAEYFDPSRAADKTEQDAHWALDRARSAVNSVTSAVG